MKACNSINYPPPFFSLSSLEFVSFWWGHFSAISIEVLFYGTFRISSFKIPFYSLKKIE